MTKDNSYRLLRDLFSHGLRFKTVLLLILTIVAVSFSLFSFTVSIGKPHMGVIISKTEIGWSMTTIDASGLVGQAGIMLSDELVSVNNKPALQFLEKYDESGNLFEQSITELTVVDKSGQRISVTLADGSPTTQLYIEHLSLLVLSVVFWLTGFLIYYRQTRNPAATVFLLSSLALGLGISANLGVANGAAMATSVAMISTIIGPWLLLHYFVILPYEPERVRHNRIQYLIYIPALITLALMPFIGFSQDQPAADYRTIRFCGYGLAFTLIIVVVFFNFFRSKSSKTRQRMKIILFSSFAAIIPLLLLNLIPLAIWSQPMIPPGFNILFLALIPLGIGYAMLTTRLMNIDIIIRNGLIQGTTFLILGILVGMTIHFLPPYHHALSTPQRILIYMALVVIAFTIYDRTRHYIRSLFDKVLFKTMYDYRQVIDNSITTLNSLTDFREISRVVVGTIFNSLNPQGICLLLKTQADVYEIGATQGIYTDPSYHQNLIDTMTSIKSLFEFPNPASSLGLNLKYIVPLKYYDKQVGVISISDKANHSEFTASNMYLIQELAAAAAKSLERTLLIRDVNMRDTFISIASHELRSPLTVIMGYAELLIKKNPPEDIRNAWTHLILENGKKLNLIVNDMLNVSRIHSGKLILISDSISVQELLKTCLAEISDTATDHTFKIHGVADLPPAVADREKLYQVIGNLLNNAVKYSPAGGEITVSGRYDAQHNRIVIGISDQGIGISKKDRESLFTTFHRIQREETQGIPGTGLGLYIVKSWIEAMNGAVYVESELNKGSTFYIELPGE